VYLTNGYLLTDSYNITLGYIILVSLSPGRILEVIPPDERGMRTSLEDRSLQEEFAGYRQYARQISAGMYQAYGE
jgi:hypothetical protein